MTDLIVGYKWFWVDDSGALRSPIQDTAWEAKSPVDYPRVLSAVCPSCDLPGGSGCSCGIRAFYGPLTASSEALVARSKGRLGLAKVRAFGKVTTGSLGWRASFIEVVALLGDVEWPGSGVPVYGSAVEFGIDPSDVEKVDELFHD